MAVLTSHTTWWCDRCVAASGSDAEFHFYNFLSTDHRPPKGRHISKQIAACADQEPGRPE